MYIKNRRNNSKLSTCSPLLHLCTLDRELLRKRLLFIYLNVSDHDNILVIMKLGIKLLLFMIIVTSLSQCEKNNPHVMITDQALLDALIQEGVDTNGDGMISSEEAEAVTSLYVNSNVKVGEEWLSRDKIKSLDGIEAFVNLDSFDCAWNLLTTLNVSNMANLKYLQCCYNQLTNLDVSNNDALEFLDCWGNRISTLDVSNNTAITVLYCPRNQLTSLDVSNNVALAVLRCENNLLTSLDISNNTALTELECFNNQISSLDVSKNTALTLLFCAGNQLTNLDVSNNNAIKYLWCQGNKLTALDVSNLLDLRLLGCGENQLVNLDISNNSSMGQDLWPYVDCYLYIGNMPSLEKVCVWALPFPPEGFLLCADGSPNVYYTTDCNAGI